MIITLLICSSSFANSTQKSVYDLVWPDKMSKISPAKQYSQIDIEKIFGKASKVIKNVHYYAFDGFKFPLAVTYKNKKVISIHYRVLKKKSSIEELRSLGIKYKIDPMYSHDTLFKVHLNLQKLTLTYKKTSGKLYSIEQGF